MKLYIIRISGPCRAVWMLCLYHKLKIDIIDVDQMSEEDLKVKFRNKSPNHSVPLFEDDDGVVLWECHTIMRYIASKVKSSLYPANLKARSKVYEIMDFHCQHLQPSIAQGIFPLIWDMFAYKDAEVTKLSVFEGQRKLNECLDYIENKYLAASSYLSSSSVSLGDLLIATSLTFLNTINYDMSKYPLILRWLSKMQNQPFWWEANKEFDQWLDELHNKNHNGQKVNKKSQPNNNQTRVRINSVPKSNVNDLNQDRHHITKRLSSLRKSLLKKRGENM